MVEDAGGVCGGELSLVRRVEENAAADIYRARRPNAVDGGLTGHAQLVGAGGDDERGRR